MKDKVSYLQCHLIEGAEADNFDHLIQKYTINQIIQVSQKIRRDLCMYYIIS